MRKLLLLFVFLLSFSLASAISVQEFSLADLSFTGFVVEANLDVSGSAQLVYGKTGALGSATSLVSSSREHLLQVNGLAENTVYFYRVVGKDSSGNSYSSAISLTRTPKLTNSHQDSSSTNPVEYDYNVKTDFGAKGDGVTDDRVAIQNAIDTASAASTPTNRKTLFFPSGIYRVSRIIPDKDYGKILTMKPNIIIEGELPDNECISASIITIFPQPLILGGSIIEANNADNWEFNHMTIDGNGGNSYQGGGDNVAGYAQKGTLNFLIINSNNIKFDDYTGRNSWSGNIALKNVDGFTLINSRSFNTDCSVIAVGTEQSYVKNVLIENNYIDGHDWSEPIALYRGSSENVIIRDNIIKNKNHAPGIIIGSGFSKGDPDEKDPNAIHKNILIEDNIIWQTGGAIIGDGGSKENVIIRNNKIYTQSGSTGIKLDLCTNCEISNNNIDTAWGGRESITSGVSSLPVEKVESPGGGGIAVTRSSSTSITNNKITYAGWYAIYQSSNSYMTVSGNIDTSASRVFGGTDGTPSFLTNEDVAVSKAQTCNP